MMVSVLLDMQPGTGITGKEKVRLAAVMAADFPGSRKQVACGHEDHEKDNQESVLNRMKPAQFEKTTVSA
ncbi:MAG: hypothetical protein ACP5I4_13185 [Oceanipulchritudo sp.]